MIRKRFASYYLKVRNRTTVTCTDSMVPPAIPATSNDFKSLRLSLVDDLLRHGCLSSAQQVLRKIITHSPCVLDTIYAVDFAASRGMELGLDIHGAFIRKLVDLGEHRLVYDVYYECIAAKGVEPDSSIINSMVICFVKLGKLEDARTLFDELIGNGCVPCNTAYNAILRELFERQMFLESLDYLVRTKDSKLQLGMWCYNILIDGLCSKGYVGEAIKVFDVMRERTGLLPTLHNYKSLFYGLCKRGWIVEAGSVIGEMEACSFFVDRIMYTSLINACITDKKIEIAIRVFFRMLKKGCDPDTFTYTVLIQGIVRMGCFNKGWILYNQMNESRTLPDAVTYHIMISNYCKVGKVDCATVLLNNMARCNLVPSVHSYTSLVAALYKHNMFSEVDELYRSMLNKCIVPDHVLFLIIMKNSLSGNELQLSLLMLQDILRHGCGMECTLLSGSHNVNTVMDLEREIELILEKIANSSLSLANVAFGIYIIALCEMGKTDAALACMRRMADVGCSPLPFAFNSLIKCIFWEGYFESVESLFDIMQEWGIVPDMSTYLIMVHGYCKKKDTASAFHVLDQMEKRGLKPNFAIYNSIISCLSREKRIFDAETCFQRMLEAGVDPDETVYVTMIKGYLRNGRASEAHKIFEMMIKNAIQPSSHSYTAIISGLVKSNLIDEGCMYLDMMLGDGFPLSAGLYSSLIYHFLRKGEIELAFRLVDLMDRSQIEFDLILYIILVSGLRRNIALSKKRWCKETRTTERAREMLLRLLCQKTVLPQEKLLRFSVNSFEAMKWFSLKLVQKIRETKFMPNLYLYNGIISVFCCINMIEDAYTQIEMMQKQGICPNEVTFTILIGAHSRAGEIDRAIELFNMMNADHCRPDKVTYNTLLRGLCKAGRVWDALSLFLAMHKRGYFLNKASYENLLRCFCACYLSNHALKIFEEMLVYNYVPRRYSINGLLRILCEEQKLHEACLVLDMVHRSCKFPDEFATRLLVQTSCLKNSPENYCLASK